jgi:hypothetical protein
VVRRRKWVFGALLVATLLGGAAATRVEFEFDVESLYAVDGEMLDFAHAFSSDFRNDDMLLLVVLESVGANDVIDPPALTWQLETAAALSRLPHVSRVASLATWELPSIRVRPPFYESVRVVRDYPASDADANRLRSMLGEYEMMERSLVAPDRRAAVLILVLDPEKRSANDLQAAVRQTRLQLERNGPPTGYRTHLTGLPVVRARIISDLKADQLRQVPLLGGIFVVLLIALFRRPSEALLPLVAVGMAVVWTIGLMGWAGWTFNLISNALPVLLLVIGVSNCVHIICRFREELPQHGGNPKTAATATISEMLVACLLTCLTTAIGFLSLYAGGSRVLREFGLEAAAGMLLLYVAAVLCLGAGLGWFHRPQRGGSPSPGLPPAERSRLAALAARLGMYSARSPFGTIAATALLMAACLWSASRVQINSYLLETYGRDHPIREGIGVLEDKLFGLSTLEVSLAADSRELLVDPEIYRRVAEFGRLAGDSEHVILVRSYVDLFETAYRSFRDDEHHRDRMPTLDEDGHSRIKLSRRLAERSGGHLGSAAFLHPDQRRARIVCAVEDAGTRATLKLIDRLEGHLARLFPPGCGVEARITGESYLFARSLDSLIRNVFYSLCMASALIFLVIGILFRSVRAGFAVMLPNVFPLVVTLGYMGQRGLDLDAGNVVVFAVSIGIAVDNTIHFLARLQEERRNGEPILPAVERTLRGSGRAVILTTSIIVVGMTVLFTSDFLPTRRFAELTTVTMLAALLGDLIVLPACVRLFYKAPPDESKSQRPDSQATGS